MTDTTLYVTFRIYVGEVEFEVEYEVEYEVV